MSERKSSGISSFRHIPRAINDFLTDSTEFATFSPPGYYTRADPRHTQLSKLYEPVKVVERKTITNKDTFMELDIYFRQRDSSTITRLVIGGFNLKNIPSKSVADVNDGWQMPMGIADHTFYETYADARKNATKNSPFYAFLLTANGDWLDSHKVGIDGPLLHFDIADPHKLHVWILSFERHAFVGHYVLSI